MTQSLRVMIVGAFPRADSPIVGGIATSCRVLLDSSLPSRAKLTLLDSSQASNPPPGLVVRTARALLRLVRFAVRFERARPQVVMLFASPGASAYEKGVMAWYARLRRRPAILLPRGVPPAPLEVLARWPLLRRLAFGGATDIVCQGAAWHRFAIGALGLPAHRAPVVPNWTATPELLAIGKARRAMPDTPLPLPPPSLLYLGWVEREKGVLDLLAACEHLKDQLDFRLDIVGDGHAAGEVAEWIHRHGMGHRVHFHGWLQGEAKLERLRRADVFALPSWAEGLPNAMIEAMACRLACVVTAVGNIPSTIGDTGAAALVPARDVKALAEALCRVIEDAAHRTRLAETGYSLAKREFGAEQAVDRLLAIAERSLPT
ncbi:MAG: glycosyltransferase family 4 protein [Rubrivivax sp.]|nr:glycosyltransferase family 4 protein [Rubrivivax sp.]